MFNQKDMQAVGVAMKRLGFTSQQAANLARELARLRGYSPSNSLPDTDARIAHNWHKDDAEACSPIAQKSDQPEHLGYNVRGDVKQ